MAKPEANDSPTSPNPPGTREQEEELRDVFTVFDKDGDDRITTLEIKQVLSALGRKVSEQQIMEMISSVDLDSNGSIDFEEFREMMSQRRSATDFETKLQNAFRLFDQNSDGVIDEDELKCVLDKLGIEANDEEIHEMIVVADLNKDGKVDFSEFKAILSTK
ncbi:neo-calmodulin-like [Symsagittifera roscoffensis]|uniref:neo-calmodulin-like n=1 Tax=Symsagittifera roscoffensis TaxID=84072 RepID=UPI00307B9895